MRADARFAAPQATKHICPKARTAAGSHAESQSRLGTNRLSSSSLASSKKPHAERESASRASSQAYCSLVPLQCVAGGKVTTGPNAGACRSFVVKYDIVQGLEADTGIVNAGMRTEKLTAATVKALHPGTGLGPTKQHISPPDLQNIHICSICMKPFQPFWQPRCLQPLLHDAGRAGTESVTRTCNTGVVTGMGFRRYVSTPSFNALNGGGCTLRACTSLQCPTTMWLRLSAAAGRGSWSVAHRTMHLHSRSSGRALCRLHCSIMHVLDLDLPSLALGIPRPLHLSTKLQFGYLSS